MLVPCFQFCAVNLLTTHISIFHMYKHRQHVTTSTLITIITTMNRPHSLMKEALPLHPQVFICSGYITSILSLIGSSSDSGSEATAAQINDTLPNDLSDLDLFTPLNEDTLKRLEFVSRPQAVGIFFTINTNRYVPYTL
ncbi:hypothetical protein Pelo_4441 [Pelomyxa schiedti]|nr:hypothetical protein Pelo_4441 [Pelomyxa schiedti]